MKRKINRNWIVGGGVVFLALIVALLLVPIFGGMTERSTRMITSIHARQIYVALRNHAIDHNGVFPTADRDSNTAFRQLFSQKFQDEHVFYVPGSAWSPTKPDNEIRPPPEYPKALVPGENHYAYVKGLNSSAKGNLPLIADGFSDVPGVYSNDPKKRGGVWNGYAFIVRVDGSAQAVKPAEDFRVYTEIDGKQVDLFSEAAGTPLKNVLNPDR